MLLTSLWLVSLENDLVACANHGNCPFLNILPSDIVAEKQYGLLIKSYCQGTLHEICRRKQYESEYQETPPADMSPNGYLLGRPVKMYG